MEPVRTHFKESKHEHHKFEWNPQGQRKGGRPKNTWSRVLTNDLKKIGKTWGETKIIAKDRGG